MNKAILILAILAICLTSNVLSANMRGAEDQERELASINLGNLGNIIGSIVGSTKNSTANTTTSNNTTNNSTTIANNSSNSNNNSSSSSNSTSNNNTTSSSNNSTKSTNTTSNSTIVSNNTSSNSNNSSASSNSTSNNNTTSSSNNSTQSTNTTSNSTASNNTISYNNSSATTNNTASANNTSSNSTTVANNTNTNSNNSSASTNTTSSSNNTQPSDSDASDSSDDSDSATNSTNTTATSIKYAKNDVNMTTFPNDCLTVHNQERMAVGLANLTWSTSLAASAQAWAENMAVNGFRHSGKTGENIASSTYSTKTLSRLLGLWTKEKDHYIPGCTYGKCSTTSAEVGHYTQMVWWSTTQVGCGFAPGANRGYNYLCCQYYKAGNIIGQQVYPYPIPTTSN